MVEIKEGPKGKNLRYQGIFSRGIKLRTDVVYTDPETKKEYRVKYVYGLAKPWEKVKDELRARTITEKAELSASEKERAEANFRQAQALKVRERQRLKQKEIPKTIKERQKDLAKKKVGSIIRVDTRFVKDPITKVWKKVKVFQGTRGRYITPEKSVRFTGRERFGGIASKELPITPAKKKAIQKRLSKQFQKRVKAVSEKQEKAKRKDQKFIIGRIPEKEAKVKTYEQLTSEEKRSVLNVDNLINILGRGDKREYDKFKTKLPFYITAKRKFQSLFLPSSKVAKQRRESFLNSFNNLSSKISNNIKLIPGATKRLILGNIDITRNIMSDKPTYSKELNKVNGIIEYISALSNLKNSLNTLKNDPNNINAKKSYAKNKSKMDLARKKFTPNIEKILRTENSRYVLNTIKGTYKGTSEFIKELTNFLAKGISDNVKGAFYYVTNATKEIRILKSVFEIIKSVESFNKIEKKAIEEKRELTKKEKDILKSSFKKFQVSVKEIKTAKGLQRAKELLSTQEARMTQALAIILGGSYLASLGVKAYAVAVTTGKAGLGITTVGLISKGALNTIRLVNAGLTVNAVKKVLENPTYKNIAEAVFYAAPEMLSFIRQIKKVTSSKFLANVKNARDVMSGLKLKRQGINKLILKAKKSKDIKNIKYLLKERIRINKAISELNFILRNKSIIKSREINPLIPSNLLKRYQGSVKELYHVTTLPNVNELFGQLVTTIIKDKKILAKYGKLLESRFMAKGIKPLGIPFTKRSKITQSILRFVKKEKLPITGSYAQNLFLKGKFRRIVGDIDIKSINPKATAESILKYLKKLYPNTKFNIQKLPKAYRINVNGKGYLDIAKWDKKIETLNFLGYNIVSKKDLIQMKLKALKTRAKEKDLQDLIRFSEGKIKVDDILKKKDLPNDVMEIVEIPGGMGKDRIKFGENHLYMDIEAPLYYGKANVGFLGIKKGYSVLVIPKARISRFPLKLQKRLALASRNLISQKDADSLRKILNVYIKNNPNKFFPEARTLSYGIGERQVVKAVGGQLRKGDINYKTFDNDLRKFIEVAIVGQKTPKSKNFIKRFIDIYKKKPFTTLKLRLNNPDLLLVKKYQKFLRKNYELKPSMTKKLGDIINKFFKGKDKKIKQIIPKKIIEKQIKEIIKIDLKPEVKLYFNKIANNIYNISQPVLKQVNLNILKLRRLLRLSNGVVTKPIKKILNKLELLIKKSGIKIKYYKFKIGEKISKLKKPVAIRKLQRVTSKQLTKINVATRKTILKAETIIGNLDIRLRFYRYNSAKSIKSITFPVLRQVNLNILKLRRLLRISKGKITSQIKNLVSSINNSVFQFNYYLRLLVEKLPMIKKPVAIRKLQRVTSKQLTKINVATRKTILKAETIIGNLDIRLRFYRYNSAKSIKSITFPVLRQVNLNILKLRRLLRISKGKITSQIKNLVSSINNSVFQFNYYLRLLVEKLPMIKKPVAIRKLQRVTSKQLTKINVATRKTILKAETIIGNLDIRLRFYRYNSAKSIKSITFPVLRQVNLNILKLRRLLRISKGKITSQIKNLVSSINNSVFQFNYYLRLLVEKLPMIKKPVAIRKLQRVTSKQLTKINVATRKTILKAETIIGNLDIRLRFYRYNSAKSIKSITFPVLKQVNLNILKLRRLLRISKGKITSQIKNLVSSINNSVFQFNYYLRLLVEKLPMIKKPVAIRKLQNLINKLKGRLSKKTIALLKKLSPFEINRIKIIVEKQKPDMIKNIKKIIKKGSKKKIKEISPEKVKIANNQYNKAKKIKEKAFIEDVKKAKTLKEVKQIEKKYDNIFQRLEDILAKKLGKEKTAIRYINDLRRITRRRILKIIRPRIIILRKAKIREAKRVSKLRKTKLRTPIRKPTIRKAIRKPSPRKPKPRTPIRKPDPRKPKPRIPVKRTPVRKPRVRIPKSRIPIRKPKPRKIIPKPKPKLRPFILTWDTKLKSGYLPLVNPIVRVKGRNRELRWNDTPNKVKKRIKDLVDNTTARSFQLKIVGTTKRKDIGKQSLSKFRFRRGKDKRILIFVEKVKHAIDTKGEKAGLSLAKKLSKRKRRK